MKILEMSAVPEYDHATNSEYCQIRFKFPEGWSDATDIEMSRLIMCWNACDGIDSRMLRALSGTSILAKANAACDIEREKLDAARDELRLIREAINANPEESTIDEVRRLAHSHKILIEANQRLGERVICGREAVPVKAQRPALDTGEKFARLIEEGAEMRRQRDRLLEVIERFSTACASRPNRRSPGGRIMAFDFSLDLCRRNVFGMTFAVEAAICIGEIPIAAKFLRSYGVPFEVAHRALLLPNLRRRVTA